MSFSSSGFDLLRSDLNLPRVITDVSPPRGPDSDLLTPITAMRPDAFVVAYAPGRAVRADPVAVATLLTQQSGIPAIPTIATRDVNALAFSNSLVGMAMLGIPGVLILGGDRFGPRDLGRVAAVGQVIPSEGVRIAAQLRNGKDFRGTTLVSPLNLAVGAAVDLNRGLDREVPLTKRKVEAGADFLLLQPVYEPEVLATFRNQYAAQSETPLPPVFVGIEIPMLGGVTFASQPEWMRSSLETGKSGAVIALELARRYFAAGERYFYVVPPIAKGGVRDYEAAIPLIERIKAGDL